MDLAVEPAPTSSVAGTNWGGRALNYAALVLTLVVAATSSEWGQLCLFLSLSGWGAAILFNPKPRDASRIPTLVAAFGLLGPAAIVSMGGFWTALATGGAASGLALMFAFVGSGNASHIHEE